MGNLDASKMFFRADAGTEKLIVPRIDGREVRLVATQESTRTKKKRTVYVYSIEGTQLIVFNRSRNGKLFMKIAIRPQNVKRFYDTFVKPPLTEPEKVWLERYNYSLV